MKTLQTDTSIAILPAEKGRSAVILNRVAYLENCLVHIKNGPNQLLEKYPPKKPKLTH